MRLIKLISNIIVFSLTIISCQNKKNDMEKRNIEEIIVFTINKMSFALPPPPIFSGDSIINDSISPDTLDSLNAVKMKVALYPKTKNLSSDIILYDQLDIKLINSRSQHEIIFADTIILKESRDWKEYDLLFTFSKIHFNPDFSSAEVALGISRSALWGQAYDIFYLKDENGKWIIERSIKKEKW